MNSVFKTRNYYIIMTLFVLIILSFVIVSFKLNKENQVKIVNYSYYDSKVKI